jgi:hypothetical protein
MKKEATPKYTGLKRKASERKEAAKKCLKVRMMLFGFISKMQNVNSTSHEGDFIN